MNVESLLSTNVPSGPVMLLASFALQATLVLGAALLLHRTMGRRWSAANQHALLVLTALLIPCLLGVGLITHTSSFTWALLTVEREFHNPAQDPALRVNAKLTPLTGGNLPTPSALDPETAASRAEEWRAALGPRWSPTPATATWLWAGGTLAGGMWLLLGLLQLALVKRRSAPCPPALQRILSRQQAKLVPHARVALLKGCQGEMPMTWGLASHTILLPAEADSWSPALAHTALRHELSHVARRDFFWMTLVRASLLPCWFHPLAWRLAREVGRTAELASDDLATSPPASRVPYARLLLAVVRRCQHGPRHAIGSPFRLALAMGKNQALRHRVDALLNDGIDRAAYREQRLLWQLPATLLLAGALGTMSACKKQEKSASTAPVAPTETTPASGTETPDETRVYRLSDGQRTLLLNAPPEKTPQDPGGQRLPSKPVASTDPQLLLKYATNAHFHLINQAKVGWKPNRPPRMVMPDIRTLIVTTDVNTHDAIAKYLASHDPGEQVLIRSYLLEVEAGWVPWRELGIQEPTKDQIHVQGILTPQQGLALLERIGKDTGVLSLSAAPAVTTRSGQRTQVDMVREFIYPVEFAPPKVLEAPPGRDAKATPNPASLPIMPTMPTAFEMRPVGVRLEYDPVVLPDKTHHIELHWEMTDFLGFMNYGIPIKSHAKDNQGRDKELLISDNKIQQPIFESLKLTTSFAVPDGSYVVIGGIKPERQAPATVDSTASFTPATPIRKRKDGEKPSMYILIMQPTCVINMEKSQPGQSEGSK